MSWPLVKLGDIFYITSSKRVHEKDWRTKGVPFYRAREVAVLARNGLVDNGLYIDESMYEDFKAKYGVPIAGDLLVTAVGTLGKVYIVKEFDRFYFKDASVIWLTPNVQIDSSYVRHALNSTDVQRFIQNSSGATVGTYTISRANETVIPLPPLSEQKRIAAILDKADAIRRKRQRAIQVADDLLRAVFLDMFGDPAVNPKEWELKSLADVCKKITDGTHHSPPIINSGVPYVTAKHLKKTGLQFFDDPWYVSEEDHRAIYSRCAPERNDVLYIKDGATTGLAAINEYDFEFSTLSSLALLKPDFQKVFSEYLIVCLNSPEIRRVMIANMAGAAITRLTLAKIKSVRIPVPPIEMQEKFKDLYVKIRETTGRISGGVDASAEAFGAISQKAFTGQL